MKIEIKTATTDGLKTVDTSSKTPGHPAVFKATPGSKIQIVVDGVPQTGKEPLGGQKVHLKKIDNDLLVETLDGEPLVQITDFYQQHDAVLIGDSWTFADSDRLVQTAEGVVYPTQESNVGIGGFILNGAAPNDTSGWTVAPGGDINGDGLADLLVGAPYASPGGISAAGQSYVLFGGTQWLSHVVQGSGAINGTTADEVLVGSSGADTLLGGGGIDRFYAGAGDDVITLGAADIVHLQASANGGPYAMVAGGTGIDTLRLTGGASIDFSQIAQIAAGVPNTSSRLSSIERLDLASDSAANTVDLRLQDLLDLSGLDNFNSGSGWSGLAANVARHQLRIDGAAGDQVVLHLADGWTNTGSATFGGVSYAIWDSAGSNAGQLLVAGASVAVI